MTTYGCNDPEGNQWSSAYINITFKHSVYVSNQETGKVGMKSPSLLAGPYGDRSYQMNFCVRESVSIVHDDETDGRWPPGNYMVYGTENGCPSGKYDFGYNTDICASSPSDICRHLLNENAIPFA